MNTSLDKLAKVIEAGQYGLTFKTAANQEVRFCKVGDLLYTDFEGNSWTASHIGLYAKGVMQEGEKVGEWWGFMTSDINHITKIVEDMDDNEYSELLMDLSLIKVKQENAIERKTV